MKYSVAFVVAAAGLALASCGKDPSEKLADRVEAAADNRADTMEENADALRNQAAALDEKADRTRDIGDARSDAIEAADRNVAAMSQAQRDAIVANQAAAVR